MNSSQIASVVEIGIPLLLGVLLLARPSLFVNKSLNASAKNRLAKGGALLIIAAGLVFIANVNGLFSDNEVSTEEFLAAVVRQNNQVLPRYIDEFTTLERVSSSGDTFLYHYRLRNFDSGGLSADAASDILKPELVSQLSSLKSIGEFRRRKIDIHHVYGAADDSVVFVVKIAWAEY